MCQVREMRIRRVVSWALVTAVFCTSGYGRTIHVDQNDPAAFATIQAAIDDANDGDTVLVAPGTYTGDGNRDIDFQGKAITVKSEQGPETCIVDCGGSPSEPHRGFVFQHGEHSDSVLEGFTVTGGWLVGDGHGGGVLVTNASPQIVDCIIRHNRAYRGGGIGIADSGVCLERCLISNNTAADGGGVEYFNQDQGNVSLFLGCIFVGNYAESHPRYGGEGGGILLGGNARLINCVIAGNRAGYRGGGICSRMSGHYCDVRNCIIWANERDRGDGHQISTYSCNGVLRVSYTIIQDGNDDIADPKRHIKGQWQERHIEGQWQDADPCFAQDGHWSDGGVSYDWADDFWVKGDYHLKSQAGRWEPESQSWVKDEVTSLCIDAGDPNSPVAAEPFPNGGRINMGAYGGTAEASKSPSGLHAPYGGGPGSGRTIRVGNDPSADYPTIQAAIDDANDGDTVLVAPGTYTGDGNRDIDFLGKGIILRSEQGPGSCIIHCGGRYPAYVYPPQRYDHVGRAFYFHAHQAANSLVQGFTVTGAVAPYGDAGGAFYFRDSRLTIRDCIIISNTAGLGGGIYARDSEVRAENCIITENNAYGNAGPGGTGGGVYVSGGATRFSNCLIAGNVATYHSGGVFCAGNHRFVNCVIAGNRAGRNGGAGGISLLYSEKFASYLISSIIWDNTAGFTGRDVVLETAAVPAPGRRGVVEARYSLIGEDSSDVDDRITGSWLTGAPLFTSPGYWDPNSTPDDPNDDFWVRGDYHLKSQAGRWDSESQSWAKDEVTSPCIDAGDPNSLVGAEPEPNGGRINMGAYGGTAEASKSPWGLHGPYGSEGGSGRITRVGNDLSADYPTIQAAVDDASDGDIVLVAPGTYRGDGNRDIDFQGKAITVQSEQGAESTIVDCQGKADEPHRGFYFHNAEDANSILRGFTIRNGYVPESGGAISCWMASPHVTDCVLTNCFAIRGGGGMAALHSSVSVDDCIVVANRGGPGGGILYDNHGTAARPAMFSGCTVVGNQTSDWRGGGGVWLEGNATFINCTICDNRAPYPDQYGGGLYCGSAYGNRAILRNCIVWGNTSPRGPEIVVLGSAGILGTMFVTLEYSLIGTDPNGILDWNKHVRGHWLQADPLIWRRGYWDTNGTPSNFNDDFFVAGDYHLMSQAGRWDPESQSWVKDEITSPCLDAGDPNGPLGAEPFPNGGRINMGAYGGTAEASKSPSGVHARYGDGAGESNDPYLIYTAEQFRAIGANPDDWDRHFAREAANCTADTWQISEGRDYPRLWWELPEQP